MRVHQTLLFTDANANGSQPIPEDLRRRMERYYMPEKASAASTDAAAAE